MRKMFSRPMRREIPGYKTVDVFEIRNKINGFWAYAKRKTRR